jgi:lipopolysaccharide/colanic/teichoic acid biosynthesis glycosyltransferase
MPLRRGVYRDRVKPFIDRYVAAIGLVILLPLLAAIVVAVWWKLGWPVIFSQLRPGKFGRPFRLHKFRTMTMDRNAAGCLRADGDRLTPFGRWLRSTSFDELPELWNVLRGDMSLVGPRPLLPQYLKHYSPRQARRHEVLPGITGLAQVKGRNAITWKQRFACDLAYVDALSFGLDCRILLMTVVRVLRRSGINAPGDAPMPIFEGSSCNHEFRKVA